MAARRIGFHEHKVTLYLHIVEDVVNKAVPVDLFPFSHFQNLFVHCLHFLVGGLFPFGAVHACCFFLWDAQVVAVNYPHEFRKLQITAN